MLHGCGRLAEKNADLLRSDKDAHYDEVIHIDLNTLVPHVNGPFTPDLANPIDKLGANASANGATLVVVWAGWVCLVSLSHRPFDCDLFVAASRCGLSYACVYTCGCLVASSVVVNTGLPCCVFVSQAGRWRCLPV